MSAAMVKERPILFSGEMVRAILDGRKTQTRRVATMMRDATHVRPAQGLEAPPGAFIAHWHEPGGDEAGGTWFRCPYGRPGDRLWVREAWAPLDACTHSDPGVQALADRVFYRADGSTVAGEIDRWRPSIHMPRWASRITLEVTDVRVERLQEIRSRDAAAEGYPRHDITEDYDPEILETIRALPEERRKLALMTAPVRADAPPTPRQWFRDLWDSINAARGYGWDANPWVWVVEFRRIEEAAARLRGEGGE